jgi:hypothetical protein
MVSQNARLLHEDNLYWMSLPATSVRSVAMEYHTSEQVNGRRWEHEQSSVIEEIRRRAQHDLAAQHPGSTVTIDRVRHTAHTPPEEAVGTEGATTYLVEVVVEYILGGEPNPAAA